MTLLDTLHYKIGCFYLSDLHKNPYRQQAKQLLGSMDLTQYSVRDIADALSYLFAAGY